MRVKICGIMEPQHANWAVEAGADMLGFIFAPSRRRISAEKSQEIGRFLAREGLRRKVALVGVFVNEKPNVVNQMAEACELDCVQLSGDETLDCCGKIGRPIIRSVKLDQTLSPGEVSSRIEEEWSLLGANRLAILIEPRVSGFYGGTGKTLHWESLGRLSDSVPVLLAGGLNPENVGEACRIVRPWGVDASSGVEKDGVKDEASIWAFVTAVRRST